MMNRRVFVESMGIGALSLKGFRNASSIPPAPVEKIVASATPAIALNHLGFVPDSHKILVYRVAAGPAPKELLIWDLRRGRSAPKCGRPLTRIAGDLGDCVIGDFSDLKENGIYQITVGTERSVPFLVRADVWRRTLPKAASYFHAQRCGIAVPGVHPACHLDDGRLRETGKRVDTTGGWHSAGDVRKTGSIMMNSLGLLHLARNLGERWDLAGSSLTPLLDEIRWGNRYFHKIQDPSGYVWFNVGGGATQSDSSDNRWTDNVVGNHDDRYINVSKAGLFQAMFVVLQAMVARTFQGVDRAYSRLCLSAALRCWDNLKIHASLADYLRDSERWEFGSLASELGWWILGALELTQATGQGEYEAAAQLARHLLSLQVTEFTGSQRMVRGYWRSALGASTPSVESVYSALAPLSLLELSQASPAHPDAGRWRDAVQLYLEDYVKPLCNRSAFRIMPYGVFLGSPTSEHYRPLAGELTYRYFMPIRKTWWWLGMTSHLECHALLLAKAARVFGSRDYRDLAYRQLEWVMGANPFGACLMTGEGMRNPCPYSVFVGPIPGGIVNGIAGNVQDEPILDTECIVDWRTGEYWSPHNAFYLWAVSALESA